MHRPSLSSENVDILAFLYCGYTFTKTHAPYLPHPGDAILSEI